MKKRIAVMTVTYNRKEYLKRAVHRLLEETPLAQDFRIFIYDNHSTDGTVEYLKGLEVQDKRVDIIYGMSNLGTAEGYRSLLQEKIFDQGFDFILKNDDDEFLPDQWWQILDYWNEVEEFEVLMVGFKRSCTRDYFEGLQWISRNPKNMQAIYLGEDECYFTYIAPGPQICTELGWQLIEPALSDFGEKFGGWDISIAMRLDALNKKCLVVYNKECIHFQRWEDHPDYTKEKFEQIGRVRKKVRELKKCQANQKSSPLSKPE